MFTLKSTSAAAHHALRGATGSQEGGCYRQIDREIFRLVGR